MKPRRTLASRLWYRFCRRILIIGGAVLFRVRYSGVENIPAEGGLVIVSNHQSHLDPTTVGAGCHRQMNFMARSTLFEFRPLGLFLRSVGCVPVDREGSGLAGIRETLRWLKQGEPVLMFPEGTRTEDGKIGKFQAGFVTLAVRGKAAIQPAAIEGGCVAWPRGQKLPRPRTVHVHYGQPLMPEEIREMDADEILAEVERRVRECHAELTARPVFARQRG